jgi:surface polysaccharide O-acyltransferase-like enzyme
VHSGFWHQWVAIGFPPTGPAWFVAVLLVFDCVAATLFTLVAAAMPALAAITLRLSRSPLLYFSVLLGITALVYIPMAIAFTPTAWSAFGPFVFQTSRIFHYFVYFLCAAGLGAAGLDNGLLARQGRLAPQWPAWLVAAAVAFAAEYFLSGFALQHPSLQAGLLVSFSWTLSCAASSFAFLALFLRFANTGRTWADSLAQNSYAIYLLHYMFVAWLQYAATAISLTPWLKFIGVFAAAALLSWWTAAAIRRIPLVARVV